MEKIRKEDVERFFVTPTRLSGRTTDIIPIPEKSWDHGEAIESSDEYWAQLSKVQAFGFVIQRGEASLFVKSCTKERAVVALYFFFTALEVLVKRGGLGLSRAVLMFRWLIEPATASAEEKKKIEERFAFMGFLSLHEENTALFFNRILLGLNLALDRLVYHSHLYIDMFDKIRGHKTDDLRLAASCDERSYLAEGWEFHWVSKALARLSSLFGLSAPHAESLLRLLCSKALELHQKPKRNCDHRKVKTQSQVLFTELGCPLNSFSVKKFTDMLVLIQVELDRRSRLAK